MKLLTFGFNLLLIFNLAIGPLQPVHAAPTQELAKSGPPTRIDGFGIDMSALPELNKENVDAIMQQIAATGALYIRQEIDWSLVETSPGVYDWSTAVPYDMLFAAADAQGIRIVAVLTGGPVYLAASRRTTQPLGCARALGVFSAGNSGTLYRLCGCLGDRRSAE